MIRCHMNNTSERLAEVNDLLGMTLAGNSVGISLEHALAVYGLRKYLKLELEPVCFKRKEIL